MFVNDEDTLENCKREINIMKELSGNKNIVRYMAHKVAKLPTGIYEVLVLLEYCSRGHVLDQMNKRLNRGFSEEEVITIFCDVIEAVGCLHSAKTPIGRDFIKKSEISKIVIEFSVFKKMFKNTEMAQNLSGIEN